MAEHSDAYIIGRLIHQTRLLIATDDTIPIETKLQAQPVLKEFEAALAVDEDEQDHKERTGQKETHCHFDQREKSIFAFSAVKLADGTSHFCSYRCIGLANYQKPRLS